MNPIRRSVRTLRRIVRSRTGPPSGEDWHRDDVGGFWDVLGPLQLEYLRDRGLRPDHRLLDVGCGALRGGVHFLRYLDPGHYYGIEKESKLLEAGREIEIPRYGLEDRNAQLFLIDDFDLSPIPSEIRFEFILAQSLFTQMMPDGIELCVERVHPRMHDDGAFYATFWEHPRNDYGWQHPWRANERTRTRYPLSLFQEIADRHGLSLEYLGDWGHPSGQKMLAFRRGQGPR